MATLPPTQVAAMLHLGLLSPEDLPMLAAHWVADGAGGSALAELAGLARRDPEVGELWPAAARELGVDLPVRRPRRMVLAWAAQQTRTGERDVRWLLDVLWPTRCGPDAHDGDEDLDTLVHSLDDILDWAPQALAEHPPARRRALRRPDPDRQQAAREALDALDRAVAAMATGDVDAALAALSAPG